MFRVLFVCTGNQCRSPMAEALLRRLAAADSAAPLDIRVSSAGTAAPAGFPATPQAQEACAEEGIDLTAHRSRPVSRDLLAASDLVLAMEGHHALTVRALLPQAAAHVHLLNEFAGEADSDGVPDPIGQGIEVYRLTRKRLHDLLRRSWPRMRRLAGVAAGNGGGRSGREA